MPISNPNTAPPTNPKSLLSIVAEPPGQMTNSILTSTFSYESCNSNVEMAGCIHYFSKLIHSSVGKQR